MKTYYGWALGLLATVFLATACDSNEGEPQQDVDVVMYEQAMQVGDLGAASVALHRLWARDTSKLNYADSLVGLYFQMGQYPQAALLADRVLAADPKNERILRVAARSNQRIGRAEIALTQFQQLHNLTNNLDYLYRVAVEQYYLNRLDEARITAETLLKNRAAADSTQVVIVYNENQQQAVPVSAAAFNLLANVALQADQPEAAKKFLEQSLTIAPDFVLAQQVQQDLNKK